MAVKKGAKAVLQGPELINSVRVSKEVVWVMRMSFDNAHLATGGADGVLRIWDDVFCCSKPI